MASIEIHHPWTLYGLIGAFVDLNFSYFLLCASTFAFFASKILSFIGLCLPCPCNGVLGFRSAEFCWHRLLFDWPVKKIFGVQILAKSRFPFDSIWPEKERESREKLAREGNCVDRVVEVDGEACSSSASGQKSQKLVDRETGFDVKGKRLMNRRRRRALLADGKFRPSVLPKLPSSCDVISENEHSFGKSLGRISGKDDDLHSYDLNTPSGYCKDDAACRSSNVLSESEKIKILERALAEERASCASLCLELEKERAASASAADEAMAMIARLQKAKASMEIETRQYERMIEEKFAYDEEEIDILKEILVRRERENLFLEKEVEAYRRMSVTGDEQSNDDDIISCNNYVETDASFPSDEIQSQSYGHELIEKTVILVDRVHGEKLNPVPEAMNDCHYSDEN